MVSEICFIGSRKSSGPDGFNVEFYMFYWNLIGDHFFYTAKIHVSCGRTYVALIPKKDNSISVTDFCPISLCNVF